MTEMNGDRLSVGTTQAIRDDIIQALLQMGDAFLSGPAISARTGVTRTAVWKHIQALERLGFVIESRHRLGYRLLHVPNLLLEPLLRRHLTTDSDFGRTVHWYESLASTNQTAAHLAVEGAPHGTMVAAWAQTGGRGRRGRTWFAPQSGMWWSLILKRPVPLARAAELTLLTCVAVRRALVELTGLPVLIKWPNDLLVAGRKVSGILAEIRADGENVQHAVLGVGINTNIPGPMFPEGIRDIATSILAASGQPVDHCALTGRILTELEPLYQLLSAGQPAFRTVSDEWRAASATLGRTVRVQTATGMLEGTAESLDDGGILYLRRPDGSILPIHSGDVLF